MNRTFARIVCTSLACLVSLVFLGAINLPSGANETRQSSQPRDRDVIAYKVKSKSDLKAKTQDEKARSQFFDRYGTDPLDPGASVVLTPGSPPPPLPPGVRIPTYEEFVQSLACANQLIVLGHAQQTGVLLNQKETYLFTDYKVDVERWLRPEHGAPSVKMSVSGGRVIIGGKPTIVGAADPLDPAKRYVLFLQHIPGSGFLTPSRPPIADGAQWAPLFPDRQLIPEIANSSVRLDSLADDIERLGGTCGSGRGR